MTSRIAKLEERPTLKVPRSSPVPRALVIGFLECRKNRFHTGKIGRSGFCQTDSARCAGEKRRADLCFQGSN